MIVLASTSPRRSHLLSMLGIEHVVDPAGIPEEALPGESPRDTAVRLAGEKARAVALRRPDARVLAADTMVVLNGEVLGKPISPEEAKEMLMKLSGQMHTVVTGVALAHQGEILERCDETDVWFRSLDATEIAEYVETGEPLDKAGSYGVQGRGALLVDRIEGDFFSVMGLPVRLVAELMRESGLPYRFTR